MHRLSFKQYIRYINLDDEVVLLLETSRAPDHQLAEIEARRDIDQSLISKLYFHSNREIDWIRGEKIPIGKYLAEHYSEDIFTVIRDTYPRMIAHFEAQVLRESRAYHETQTEAARSLGLPLSTFHNKLRKCNLMFSTIPSGTERFKIPLTGLREMTEELKREICSRFVAPPRDRGSTQAEIAKKLGISYNTLRRLTTQYQADDF